jgi:hypothetical protein
MRIHRFIAAIAVVVFTGALLAAQAPTLTGTWSATFDTQVGEQTYTYELMVKGTELMGMAKGNLTGDSKISEGKVDGKMFTFVENATYEGMPLRITYSGTVTSADEISLTRTVVEGMSEQFVAKRVK